MRRLALIATLAGLAAHPRAAGAQVVVQEQNRTYDVEVVASDVKARTLTIHGDGGTTTLLVDAMALRGLEGLQPGSQITITVRNAATGRQEAITAIVNGTLRTQPKPASVVETTSTTIRREVGTPVEVRGIDRATRKLIVRNGEKDQVFVIGHDAQVDFDELAPGQRVLLSWRFNRAGEPEAIIRVTPAPAVTTSVRTVTKTEVLRVPGPVEVISADPEAKTLTIRGEGGESQTVLVDDLALANLHNLKAGDSVLLSWGGDRVIVIAKK